MAESILAAIILAVWIILGLTLFCRGSAMRRILARNTAAPEPDQTPTTDTSSRHEPTCTLADESFRCMIETVAGSLDRCGSKAFSISIRGRICVPTPMHETQVQVLLIDDTDGPDAAQPVLCAAREWQLDDSPAFCYKAANGRIPATEYVLSDWVPVAVIPLEVLRFPRRGRRTVECVTSLLSLETGYELACATALLEYHNPDLGYVDARENAEQSEILTVQLAVAVGSAATAPQEAAVRTIEDWICARAAAGTEDSRHDERSRRLTRVLHQAVDTCISGRKLDIERICTTLRSVATIVDIYDAMKLCLRTIGSAGTADRAQTALIGRIAKALQVDEKRFRAMSQKILPVALHKETDLEFILGISADMDPDVGRLRLREEYQKWNARVTNPDPAIQAQADQMLALIAEARDRLFDEVPAAGS